MKKKILVLNGPNLNMLGRRQPEIYGTRGLDDIIEVLRETFPDTDIEHIQSNCEGFLIDALKRSPMCPPQHDGLVQYNCVIAHCPAHLTDALKNGDFSELNGYIGEPKATFSNYAVDETIAEAEVVVIHSGMTVPMDRFAEPKAKVAANKAKYEKSSALSLASTRQATELHKDASASAIVMGSGKSSGADLSFLDSEEF